MSDMAFDSDFTQMIENASPEQREQIMQLLNPDQQALALPYQFSRPGNVGDIFRNIGSNLVNRAAVKYGLRPDPQQVLANQQFLSNALDLAITERDQQREQRLRQSLMQIPGMDTNFIKNASLDTLEQVYADRTGPVDYTPGIGYTQQNLLTNAQNVLAQSPTSVQEYEFARQQAEDYNKNLRAPLLQREIPDFDEWLRRNKLRESQPAAVKTFEFLEELNPEIKKYSAEDKQALMFKIMRSGIDTQSIFLEADAKARGGAGGLNLTPGQERFDQEFAIDHAEYVSMGGFQEHKRNIRELNGVIQLLNREDPNTSNVSGRAVALSGALLDRSLRSDLSINIEDTVGRIVVKDLRATLGSQFTDDEGKRFIGYAYNVMLSPQINAQRIARLRNTMEAAAEEKLKRINYWEQNGTLAGYKGAYSGLDISKNQIYESVFKKEDYKQVSDQQLRTMIDALVKDDNSIIEELNLLFEIADDRDLYKDGYGVK